MDKFLRSQSYSRKQIEAAAAWVPLEVDKDAAAVPKPVRVASAKRGMDAFMAQLEARDSMRRPVTVPNEAAQEASHEAEEEGEEAEQSRVQHQGVEQEPKPGGGQVHAEGGGLQRDPIQLDQLDQAEVERMQTRDTGEVVEQEGGGKAARSMKEVGAMGHMCVLVTYCLGALDTSTGSHISSEQLKYWGWRADDIAMLLFPWPA